MRGNIRIWKQNGITMGLNLQNIETDLLRHFTQPSFGEAFVKFVEGSTAITPVVVLGHRQFSTLFPDQAAKLQQMKNVIYDGDPDFAVKVTAPVQVIFANFRIGGVERTEEYQWLLLQSVLPHTGYVTPLQDWFSTAMRDNGEGWLAEACDQEYQKKISYIVLSGFDNTETLTVMLKSFCEYTEPRDDNELIVVLNGYTEFPQEAISVAAARGFSVKTVFRNKNVGVALGFNEGLRMANGEYICCIQDDITFSQPNWDRELSGYLDQYPQIGIVGGHTAFYTFHTDMKSPWDIPYCHVNSTIKGRCDWPLMKQALVQVDQTVCICMMVRRDLAMFDWHFAPTGLDDLGVCMEARRKGFEIYATDVGIEHAMITSVIRGKLDQQSANARIDKGMQIMRAFHLPYFVETYGDMIRSAASKGAINTPQDMERYIKVLPKAA
ncbi:MAG TPA: glycosyltransferase family A protein [Alphaproteobacteria bacterium]|nr:glycosyltransferase family A protein [Alphaproteobacteria bacterium]